MSYSKDLNLYNEDNIYLSPRRFNRTYNTLKQYTFFNSSKSPSIKITKNLKKNFFSHNKRILSQNYFKDNYLYNHEKMLTYHQNNKRCQTLYVNKKQKIMKNLGLTHKNMLKYRLTQSKLYKLIEKTANENYLKNKREKEKDTFITMIENNNYNNNEDKKVILSFDQDETQTMHKTKEESNETNDYSNKNHKKYDKNDIMSSNKMKKKTMLLDFNKNIINLKKINFSNNNILLSGLNSYNNKNRNDNNNQSMKKVLFNHTFTEKNNSLDLSKLKPISLPCIKFNNALDDYFKYIIEGNRNAKHALAKTCIAKLRFEIINKSLIEHYRTTIEKNEFPVNLANTMFNFYIRGKKYFYEFDDLYKKYLAFLSLEIKKHHLKLNELLEERDNLFTENNKILKNILDLKEEKKMYEALKRLCLMIKYKTRNINDIPKEVITKYGIIFDFINRYIKNSNNEEKKKKAEESKKTKEEVISKGSKKKLLYNKNLDKNTGKVINPNQRRGSSIKEKKRRSSFFEKKNFVIRQQIPIFKNADDFFKKFEEGNQDLFKIYESYSNSYYEKLELKSEINDENRIDQSPDSIFTHNLIKKMNNELMNLKEKNKRLNLFKYKLLGKKNHNLSEITLFNINNVEKENINNISEKKIMNTEKIKFVLDENEKTISLFKIYKKVRAMLLNPEMNIENILKDKKLYNIIKEKKTLKDIRYNGQIYSKEVFLIKLLELVYLKLIEDKNKCLKNENTRKIYLKIKNEREKFLKIYKSKQKLLDDQMRVVKRNDMILNKTNKITILKRNKNDPFHKRYLYEKLIKDEETRKKNEIIKLNLESEKDKFYNYFQY